MDDKMVNHMGPGYERSICRPFQQRLRALSNFHRWMKYTSFNVRVRNVVWNFNGYIEICVLYNFEIKRVISFNTLMPRGNSRLFPDDIFRCNFLNENIWISIEISQRFVPTGQINNIPALVQIMAWRRPGDKQLSEPVLVSLLTHLCVARP